MTQTIPADYKQIELGEIPEEWDKVELKKYIDIIKVCLDELYSKEKFLFENNLCERCLVFRLAHHLQIIFNKEYSAEGYFVDCDYNSSCYYDEGGGEPKRSSGKPIPNYDEVRGEPKRRGGKLIPNQISGKAKKRFIDIIVHKRKSGSGSNLICFEIKKWNNYRAEGMKKDENNLAVLTSQYGYSFGFYLIFGKTEKDLKLYVFKGSKKLVVKIYE